MSGQRDRVLLIGIILGLGLIALLLRPGPSGPGPDYRIAGRGPLGLSGLAAGLRNAGVQVSEENTPRVDPSSVTVEIAPLDVTHDDAAQWLQEVRAGGTMIYATGASDPFTRALGVRRRATGSLPAWTPAGRATFPDAAAPNYRVGHSFTVARGGRALLTAGGGSAAFQVIPVGRGAVWLASAPWFFTNAGAVETGLPIALPVTWANGRSARFDIYHQSGSGHLNALAYLPGVWTLLVIEAVLAGLLLVAALLRRPGPVWPEPEHLPGDPDLAPSLAQLYAKNHHAHTMAQALADDDARRLGSRAHVVEGQLRRLREAEDPDTAVLAWRELKDAERR